MVLNLLPPTEEDVFLILSFDDAPRTTAREWCYSCSSQMRYNCLEDSVESSFLLTSMKYLPIAMIGASNGIENVEGWRN
jgi:hypothetical protein